MKLTALLIALVTMSVQASVAVTPGMVTESGQGFPEGFPPHFPKFSWAFSSYDNAHCQGHSKPVASHNGLGFFGFNSCGRFSFKKDDNVKALSLWVRDDQHAMDFQLCTHDKQCFVAHIKPNSWQCVSLIPNSQGIPEKSNVPSLVGKLKSISEC
ncbi:Hypothetical protein MSYG_0905 [Malassezia sympodialis ATCC 42132]|uniref:Uncharacterized protein n=1 Tax=Malassezia sympodialis (strain ATCC 42132) TaxID=1230383 RepID=A0A1M8A2J2_MALS4|nr:Hypothetical protein MSYG_0905 [Malassezia sympodialis ATCC 42132]